jgi:hypothetical protein
VWRPGRPLENGTPIATFLVRGEPEGAVKARYDGRLGFATGDVGSARTSFTGMIEPRHGDRRQGRATV